MMCTLSVMNTSILIIFLTVAYGTPLDFISSNIDKDPLTISGGHSTNIKKHPFQASIYKNGHFLASAVIIDKKWLVSGLASQIFFEPERYTVYVGRSKLSESLKKKYYVKQVVVNPNYSLGTSYSLTLWELKKNLKFSKKVKKIKIADSSNVTTGVITGWGSNSTIGTPFNVLQEGAVQVIGSEDCSKKFPFPVALPTCVCTYGDGLVGPGSLDGGIPLVTQGKLVGINIGALTSLNYPAIFTDVTLFKEWIADTIHKGRTTREKIINDESDIYNEESDAFVDPNDYEEEDHDDISDNQESDNIYQ